MQVNPGTEMCTPSAETDEKILRTGYIRNRGMREESLWITTQRLSIQQKDEPWMKGREVMSAGSISDASIWVPPAGTKSCGQGIEGISEVSDNPGYNVALRSRDMQYPSTGADAEGR